MQMYAVHLVKGHTAKPNQVTKDGYLTDFDSDQPELFKFDQATHKAQGFGGKVVPYGKSYLITKVNTYQLDKSKLHPLTVEAARKKIAYKYVKDEELTLPQDMFICFGCVFGDILEEGKIPAEILDELRILSAMCYTADYVHFL